MRKITREICSAFENRRALKIDNSRTDGSSLWLFDNKIAEWRDGDLWVTNAGWDSRTTNERLNGLDDVSIIRHRGILFLNERVWDGRWVNVREWNQGAYEGAGGSVPEGNVQEVEFDVTSEWIEGEGYSRPIYSMYHTLVEGNLQQVEELLSSEGIPNRRMESDTEGVYRPNYFVVVRPEDVVRASSILCENYSLV